MKAILPTAIAVLAISSSAIGLVFTLHTHDPRYVSHLEIRDDYSSRANFSGCHNGTQTGGYYCH